MYKIHIKKLHSQIILILLKNQVYGKASNHLKYIRTIQII